MGNCHEVNTPEVDNQDIPCLEPVDWNCVFTDEDLDYLDLLAGASSRDVLLEIISVLSSRTSRIAALETAAESYGKLQTIILDLGEATTLTTGTGKYSFRMPYAFKLVKVKASLITASSSGIPTFDINESGTSILSTKLTIDASETTSKTAAAAAVISDDILADDALITVDIDVAGTGAVGGKIYLIGYVTADPA